MRRWSSAYCSGDPTWPTAGARPATPRGHVRSAEDRPHRGGGERHHDHAHRDGEEVFVVREELLQETKCAVRRRSERIDEHEHRQRVASTY
ncbi:hypothetical protein OPAG_08168 [Rhodococcus opacus PD630]|nr:hypothetical protein OPAG_08168 [Rhodococcus opacus PD630]